MERVCRGVRKLAALVARDEAALVHGGEEAPAPGVVLPGGAPGDLEVVPEQARAHDAADFEDGFVGPDGFEWEEGGGGGLCMGISILALAVV